MQEDNHISERTKTISVWEHPRIERVMEVKFPLYSWWISSDYSDTYNRIDEDGTLLSISKYTHEGITFEIKMRTVSLDPLDGSYVKDDTACSERDFLEVFYEMIEFVERTKGLVNQ